MKELYKLINLLWSEVGKAMNDEYNFESFCKIKTASNVLWEKVTDEFGIGSKEAMFVENVSKEIVQFYERTYHQNANK